MSWSNRRSTADALTQSLEREKRHVRELAALRAEIDAARQAVGEAWFHGGATLAEAIARKTAALEKLANDGGAS